jgi:uncharacterized protein HemX
MPKKDEWDARFAPEVRRARRQRGSGRSQGLLLILLAIGIPLVVFFLQEDGALRLYETDKIFERTLTSEERQEIRQAIDKYKVKLDKIQKVVEEVKDKYRGETGVSYDRDVWVVHVKEGLAIPFKYVLAFGAILFLIGIGKLIL